MVLDSDESAQNFEILSDCIVHWLIFRNANYMNWLGGLGGFSIYFRTGRRHQEISTPSRFTLSSANTMTKTVAQGTSA